MRNSRFLASILVLLVAVVVIIAPPRAAAQELRFIRDAEIEDTIRAYSTPIFEAAGLNPDSVNVHLIDDSSLNAFVAGGMNMFLHTGLLRRAENPLQVIGVIAHEAGHISGGHLAGRRQEMKTTSAQVLASYILGLGAAIATGRGDLGMAVTAAGQGAAIAQMLAFSRSQESAADQAAVTYLERAGLSPEGLLDFMGTLEGQEALLTSSQDPYVRTHPLTRERIRFLRDAAAQSPNSDKEAPEELREMHARMQAKLDGFLQNPQRTLRQYEARDGVAARYARAIAHFRVPSLERALTLIDELIEEHPEDAYFHELKGQMLYEHGRIDEALPAYERAVELRPRSPLIRLGLTQVQLQSEDPALIDPALRNIERILERESRNASAWRLSAIAHGRAGDTGKAALALAEAALARGNFAEARQQARRARHLVEEHSPPWIRAEDIEREAERREEQSRR